jgi:ankyrin repeat protein
MSPGEVLEAITKGDRERLDALLAERPEAAGARGSNGLSAVMLAAYHKRPEMAAAVLAARGGGADVFEAAALGLTGRLAGLLDGDPGAVAAQSPDGFTPLHLAAFFGQDEAAALLLASGADPGATAANPSRVQPLHGAVAGRHPALVARLLAAGADPDARQEGGFTPLMGAAGAGRADLASALLAAGADPALTDRHDHTAADHARQHGHNELAERLG